MKSDSGTFFQRLRLLVGLLDYFPFVHRQELVLMHDEAAIDDNRFNVCRLR
jgi:hypothetical protein